MILKRVIEKCKDAQSYELVMESPCSHCGVEESTCKHVCSILSVKRPCDIEKTYKLLNKEEKS